MTVSLKVLASQLLALASKKGKAIQWESEAAALLEKGKVYNRAESEIFVEKKSRSILQAIETEIAKRRDTQKDWCVDVGEVDRRLLVPRAAIISTAAKTKKEILGILQKSTWTEFENAGKAILKVARFTMYETGARSQEGGLDFYGLYHLGTHLHPAEPLYGWRGRAFGQAKKYGKKPMSEPEVHTVLSQVNEFNARKGKAFEKSPAWFKNDGSPVQIVLASFSGFSEDAIRLGKRHGAIFWTADSISDFLTHAVVKTDLLMPQLKGWISGKIPF